MLMSLFDLKLKEWVDFELMDFFVEFEYEDVMCVIDEGLVCFVFRSGMKLVVVLFIFVCNLLINDCKFMFFCDCCFGNRYFVLV